MVAIDNNGKIKDVKIRTRSELVFLRASITMLGDIDRRKLAHQTSQSAVGPSRNGRSFIHLNG